MFNQITPESSGVWRLRTTVTKYAKKSSDGKKFIEPFTLNKKFSTQFIAVGITVGNSKDNWRNAGYLAQEIKFSASGYAQKSKAFYHSKELLINNVLIINFPLLSLEDYKLIYFPPTYFSSVRIQVWEYVGNISSNFQVDLSTINQQLAEIKDTLNLVSSNINFDNNQPNAPIIAQAYGIFEPSQEEENLIFAYYQRLL